MPAARGPEWTDLLGNLLPVVITVIIGILAVTKRGVDALFKRRAEEAQGKPRPPLNEEVRQFLEGLDRDTERTIDRGETTSAESASAGSEPADEAVAPAASDRPAIPPAYSPATAGPSLREVSPALSVAPPIERPSHHQRRAARARSAFDLRQAVIWSELLAPPVADRPPRI